MRRLVNPQSIRFGLALVIMALALMACAAPSVTDEPATLEPTSEAAETETIATTAAPSATPTSTPTTAPTDAPSATPTLLPPSTPQVVYFGAGGTTATVSGELPASGNARYLLTVLGGQTMSLTLSSLGGAAALGVTAENGDVMIDPEDGLTEASVDIPETGDYTIEVRAVEGAALNFTLLIGIPPLPGTVVCYMTFNEELTAYFDPSADAEVFGVAYVGLEVVASARTADGWIGFDPGVAQAPNEGLDRLRWILPGSVSFDPAGCDANLTVVAP